VPKLDVLPRLLQPSSRLEKPASLNSPRCSDQIFHQVLLVAKVLLNAEQIRLMLCVDFASDLRQPKRQLALLLPPWSRSAELAPPFRGMKLPTEG